MSNGFKIGRDVLYVDADGTAKTLSQIAAAQPEFVVKQSFNTAGTQNFGSNMNKIIIENTGDVDLTFAINGITITVKPTEQFDNVFDPFTQVTVTTTGTFYAEVYALMSGSPPPRNSIKSFFLGAVDTTINLGNSAYGVSIVNDHDLNMIYTINGIATTVQPGDVSEKFFDPFTQISITAVGPFRGCTIGKYTP